MPNAPVVLSFHPCWRLRRTTVFLTALECLKHALNPHLDDEWPVVIPGVFLVARLSYLEAAFLVCPSFSLPRQVNLLLSYGFSTLLRRKRWWKAPSLPSCWATFRISSNSPYLPPSSSIVCNPSKSGMPSSAIRSYLRRFFSFWILSHRSSSSDFSPYLLGRNALNVRVVDPVDIIAPSLNEEVGSNWQRPVCLL